MRVAAATLLVLLATVGNAFAQDDRTPLCHATGDAANPFVLVNASPAELIAHLDHEDDLIPAPPGGCPRALDEAGNPAPSVTPGPTVEPTPSATAAPGYVLPGTVDDEQNDVIPAPPLAATPAPSSTPAPTPAPIAQVSPAVAAAGPGPSLLSGLPMTGDATALVAAMGLGFLLTGAGLRLLRPGPPRARSGR